MKNGAEGFFPSAPFLAWWKICDDLPGFEKAGQVFKYGKKEF